MTEGLLGDYTSAHVKNRENCPQPQMRGKLPEDACAGRRADQEWVRGGVGQ
jgi:hypothetical protein